MSLLSELLADVEQAPASKLREAALELQKELSSNSGHPSAAVPNGTEVLAVQKLPYDWISGYRWITLEIGRADEARVVLWQHKCPLNYTECLPVSTLATMAIQDDGDVQDALKTYVRVLHARGALGAA